MVKKVSKFAVDLLNDPHLNKSSAFSEQERKTYRLQGLLPYQVETIELQTQRELKNLRAKPNDLEKYIFLMDLLNRNETLFYRIVVDNIKECMPLVYTPTVGDACIQYSDIWTRPMGLYISIKDKGQITKLLRNWHTTDVKAIVFTDGERILGLGDLGVGGMGIPVGKLQLYSACAGIPPSQCLPVVIDNGTNNEKLLNDELYMGLKQKRTRGQEFDDLIEEFMTSSQKVFGKSVLLQFEDFGNSTAFGLLDKFRNRFNTFNDDIQGTACVALAGILSALKVPNTPKSLRDHKFLFFGAGEAGTGIGQLIAFAISEETKCSEEEARKNIFFVDSKGLIHKNRPDFENLAHHKKIFGQTIEGLAKGENCDTLLDAISLVRPTCLVGVSAQPKTFTKDCIEVMAKLNQVPIIFALSNPTKKCECSAQEAYEWSEQRCIFASGSPFGTVTSGDKTFEPGQGNNAYIFPGLALGVIAAEAKTIPDELFLLTAKTLSNTVTQLDLDRGSLYPKLELLRQVSLEIAVNVATHCFTTGNSRKGKNSVKDVRSYVEGLMDRNQYKPL